MKYNYFRTFIDLRQPVFDDGRYGEMEMVRSWTKKVDEGGSYAAKQKKKPKIQKELTASAEEDFEM